MVGDIITYEQYGVAFLNTSVTPARVGAAVAEVAGDVIEVGPIAAGPGNIAEAEAIGKVGPIETERLEGEMLTFKSRIPIDLDLTVRVAGTSNKYDGSVVVPLVLAINVADSLHLVVDVAPVSAADIEVSLEADGARAKVLARIGGMEREVQNAVADEVAVMLESDRGKAATLIDVATLIGVAWPE